MGVKLRKIVSDDADRREDRNHERNENDETLEISLGFFSIFRGSSFSLSVLVFAFTRVIRGQNISVSILP